MPHIILPRSCLLDLISVPKSVLHFDFLKLLRVRVDQDVNLFKLLLVQINPHFELFACLLLQSFMSVPCLLSLVMSSLHRALSGSLISSRWANPHSHWLRSLYFSSVCSSRLSHIVPDLPHSPSVQGSPARLPASLSSCATSIL